MTVEKADRLDAAVEALRPVGTAVPRSEWKTGTVSVPVNEGARSLMAAVRRLDAAGIEPVDLGLRRPSLDEVFLDLTERDAERESDNNHGVEGAAGIETSGISRDSKRSG